MTTSNKDAKNLMEWIRHNGGQISNINIYNEGQERGVVTTKKIRGGTNVVKIPKNLLIHDGLGQESYYGNQLLKGNYSQINNLKIALVVIFMLDDMRRDSFFLPYYRILPKQISNFPIFWNKKTRSLLKGSPMSRKIQDRINNFVQDYKIICNCCDGFEEEYSFNDFLFIRILVGSRNFGIRIDGVKRVAMVPFSDMLNHHQSPNISWFYDNNKKFFIMRANEAISRGNTVTDTYGNKCNSLMLLYYGFALPNNKSNTLCLTLSNKMNRTRAESKKYEMFPQLDAYLKTDLKDYATNNVFTFFRIWVADDNELAQYRYRTKYSSPISVNNEIRMLTALNTFMEKQKGKYILSYEKAVELANSISKDTQEYLALLLIIGELEIIRFYISFTTHMIKHLSNKVAPTDSKYNSYSIMLKNTLSL